MLYISAVKVLSSNLYGFIQYISTSLATIVKQTDGFHNHVMKTKIKSNVFSQILQISKLITR